MFTDEILFAESNTTRQAFIDLCRSMKPTHWGTLVFNNHQSPEACYKTIKHFFSNLERKLNRTKYFYRLPKSKRIQAICFAEHVLTNIHYHVVFVVPTEHHACFYVEVIKAWFKVCKKGNVKIDPIKTDQDFFQTTNYSLKDLYQQPNYESFILASQYWQNDLRNVPNMG
jgi:hypothetical protein